MHIAVVGGGPAGCQAARLLAEAGHGVTLIDSQGPWEKPCGGGLTAKIRHIEGALPSGLTPTVVDRVTIYFGDQTSVTLQTHDPPWIVSRKELGTHMLRAARRAGVRFVQDRVVRLERYEGGWTLETREGKLDAQFVVGADGATSFVRRTLGTPIAAADLNVTLGYFIQGRTDAHMKVFFVPSMEGYIWSFPRPDHISYGLITRADPGWTSRSKSLLENFIVADLGSDALEHAEFYSAPVPALGPKAWKTNRIAGDGWALVGDAAGLVDPITGEGIYYALRSASLLADALPDADRYASAVREECFGELGRAAKMYRRFYRGRFLGGNFRKRMVQLARRSPTIRTVLGNLVTGSQPYTGLKRRLAWSLPRVAFDLVRSPLKPA